MSGVKELRRLLRWLPAVAMMSLIFTISSLPAQALPILGALDLLIKKSAHFIGYGLLALAFEFGLAPFLELRSSKCLAFLLAVLYAVSDEVHQSLVPGRHPWWGDVLIDACGALVGLAIVMAHSNSNSKPAS
jgi:VanZ family protein